MDMTTLQKPLELIAILCGGITFGTAYYLLFLSHPAWMAVPFDVFLPVFRRMILNIGTSQIIVSNIAPLETTKGSKRSKGILTVQLQMIATNPKTFHPNFLFLSKCSPETSFDSS